MKILQINSTYGYNDSTGRNTLEMHEWLLEHGFESEVYCTKGIYDEKVRKFSSRLDQLIHAFFSRLTGLQGIFSIGSTIKVIREIKRDSPDVIVLGVLHSNNMCIPMLISYLSKKNIHIILVMHDFWYITGHCTYPVAYRCEKWKYKCNICEGIHHDNVSWFFDTSSLMFKIKQKLFNNISNLSVIGVSDWSTEEARKSPILKKAKNIIRIYNWIDMNVFRPQETAMIREKHRIPNDARIVLCVSSFWNMTKGIDILRRLTRDLTDVSFFVVGEVEDEIEGKNVRNLGRIDDMEELAEYYSMSDLFVNPSIHETFGKTIAEAFCCGIPVVCFNTTACKELVNEDRGAVVEFGDYNGFLNAVKHLLSCDKSLYRVGCRQFAERNFDINTNIKKYLEIFGEK